MVIRWILIFLFSTVGTVFAEGLDFGILAPVPVQDGGRVKPMDTFAREGVRFITGHETFEGRSAMDLLWDWMAHPAAWEQKEFILVENLDLRAFLGIPRDQKRVPPRLLRDHPEFMAFAQASYSKQQKKAALNPMETESLEVFGRLQRFGELTSGEGLSLIPLPDPQTQRWTSLGALENTHPKAGQDPPGHSREVLLSFVRLLQSYDANNGVEFSKESQNFAGLLRGIGENNSQPPLDSKMAMEVHFNHLKPFRLAWMIHLGVFLLVGFSFLFHAPKLFAAGLWLFGAGILVSAYGFLLRCLIAGRPPVSNMYESLIWVTFGMTVFALVFELIFKNRQLVAAGSLLAVVGFVLADNVPTILDSAIQPLEPVLRSNFWLTIHVLTITLSYGAFFLSLGLGHLCLWTLWKNSPDRERLQRQTKLLYRVVQVGVVLLAAGTILGGVWANYSWGRFWGWDPKETWALIALLGYVAILHGRLAGWLRERGFTIGVVAAFLGVLMAWYGVNFILGVGLHSYGFSKGGLPYVAVFTGVEILLLAAVAVKSQKTARG